MNALNFLLRILQLRLWNPTNTLSPAISVFTLNTPQTTQVLVPAPLPLGNQIGISDSFFEAPIVKIFGDGWSLVIKFVNVPGSLVVDLKDWPRAFYYSLSLVTGIFSYKAERDWYQVRFTDQFYLLEVSFRILLSSVQFHSNPPVQPFSFQTFSFALWGYVRGCSLLLGYTALNVWPFETKFEIKSHWKQF